jgi:hypothetical protein
MFVFPRVTDEDALSKRSGGDEGFQRETNRQASKIEAEIAAFQSLKDGSKKAR